MVDLVLETEALRFLTDPGGTRVTGIDVEEDGQRRVIHGDLFISAALILLTDVIRRRRGTPAGSH